MFRSIIVALLIIVQHQYAFATGQPQVQVLDGSKNQLQADSFMVVEDNNYANPTAISKMDTPYNVKNIVTFKINEATSLFLRDSFTVWAQVRITYYYGSSFGDSSYVDKTLMIHYDSSGKYQGISNFVFSGAHKVKVSIANISSSVSWNVLPALLLENEMDLDPTYKFSCTNDVIDTVNYSIDSIPTQGELYVSWKNIVAADQYDLEWTYADSSQLADSVFNDSTHTFSPDILFADNATRVTVTGTSYMIPLIYDDTGSLFFRVRPVQLKPNNAVVTADWSSDVSSYGLGRFDYGGHQRNLNWQSTITFAEEGKRKIVVQYYDGSLRNRQTVTKDNTTNTTIVAENLYDYQGRPVIQVLPAPTFNNIIQYTHDFNVGLNGSEYTKSLYDTLSSPGDYCETGAPAMSDTTGAANYYSSLNPQKNLGDNKFIPNANGYVFTETQYTQDNTGRIAKQGGVGVDHRIGSGHETQYFYGSPSQNDLDALFGTEAGIATHYFKNMVCDANGQYSISYVDMHGRTIATALAGDAPAGMQKLNSNIMDTVTEVLADSNTNVTDGLAMTSKKSLLVSNAGNNVFHYDLTPESLRNPACDSIDTVCYDCLYNLDITITDDCNNQKIGGSPIHISKANFSMGAIDTTCATPSPGFSFDTTIFLEPGNYEITKTLTVSHYAMDYYRDSVFMLKNLCANLQQFIQNQKDVFAAEHSECAPSCASCTAALGSWSSFREAFMDSAGIAPTDSASYRDDALTAYNNAVSNCNDLCGTSTDADAVMKAMLFDMTPPSGQYASAFTGNNNHDKYNIFYGVYGGVGDSTLITPPFYQSSSITYLNANGEPDSVFDDATQTMVIPQNLDSAEFTNKFNPSWANALLAFHPEKCKLNRYETHKSALQWGAQFENIDTYADAMAGGWFNPIDGVPGDTNNIDPLSRETQSGTYKYFYNQLHDSLYTYFNRSGLQLNLWSMASMMVECASPAGSADTSCMHQWRLHAFSDTFMCNGDLDMAWRIFRGIYEQIRNDVINRDVNANNNIGCSPTSTTAATLVPLGFRPNFNIATDVINQNGLGNDLSTDTATQNAQVRAAKDSVGSEYAQTCQSYVTQWMQQLAPCNYDSAQLDTIQSSLLMVCEKGSDVTHTQGSSSISPDSTNTDTTFEQVLQEFNTAHGIANNYQCNPELITVPQPYDKQPANSDEPIYSHPDSCECTTISGLYTQYLVDSSLYSSFSAYVNTVRGVNMADSDLYTLKAECDSTGPTCKYLVKPITLPAALQCNVAPCATCEQMSTLYTAYIGQYGNSYAPKYSLSDTTDSTQLQINQLFTNYMNNRLGFNKTLVDYVNFMDTCKIIINTADTVGNSYKTTLNNFRDFYDSLNFDQIYKNDQITPCVQTLIDGANAAFGAYAIDSGLSYSRLPLGYAVEPRNTTFNSKLGSVTHYASSASVAVYPSLYTVVAPASLECAMNYPGNEPFDTEHAKMELISPQDTDFAVPLQVTAAQLAGHYFAPVLRETPNLFYIIWGIHNGLNSATAYFGEEYLYYGVTTPENNFILPDTGSTRITSEVFGMGFIRSNDTLSSAATYAAYVSAEGGAGNYIPLDSVRKLYNLRFINSNLIPTNYNSFVRYGSYLEVSVQYTNGTTGNAYMLAGDGSRMIFKNIIDTNLYNIDCQKAFTTYFNTKYGTGYSYNTIDSIYYNTLGYHADPCYSEGSPMLCNNNATIYPVEALPVIDNCTDSSDFATNTGTDMYTAYTDSLKDAFDSMYSNKCLNAYKLEHFKVTHAIDEYHYTLYSYDQAGNLVKTTPPKGVVVDRDSSWTARVDLHRSMQDSVLIPNDSLFTNYRYNTLNQVIAQLSPDGGESHFWYDVLGRLCISQNNKQRTANNYSYTLYDSIGRITEVGEISSATAMTDSISRSLYNLNSWFGSAASTRTQITQTVYDTAYGPLWGVELTPDNLRNRVAYTSYYNTAADIHAGGQASATYYSYDIEGNVDTLVQDYNQGVMKTSNRFKKIAYDYDLVSGKVNTVAYQPGQTDAFYHQYLYDAENRIINVLTSHDSVNWDNDAFYEYYKHGPLSRTVIGQQQVQGIDYAYTLQGWLKGVNLAIDGDSTNVSARDEYNFALDYNDSDYAPIGDSVPLTLALYPSTAGALGSDNRPLYNGNISSMAVDINKLNQPLLYNYQYDQLNRLVSMDAWSSNNAWSSITKVNDFKERVSYDPNGNILSYLRNGNNTFAGMPLSMDSLTYNYNANNNQLNYVQDSVNANNYTTDIDNQSINNYAYDSIGNMTKDVKEGIDTITWTVYGKIDSIYKYNGTAIKYTYDAAGNRISKTVSTSGMDTTTYYVRDASGNIMSVYEAGKASVNGGDLTQSEVNLYGSSRLGTWDSSIDVQNPVFVAKTYMPNLTDSGYNSSFTRGQKQYELTNHLGNVLVTVSDKKKLVLSDTATIYNGNCEAGTGLSTLVVNTVGDQKYYIASNEIDVEVGFDRVNDADSAILEIDSSLSACVQPDTLPAGSYYAADVITAQDFFPGGMLEPGRVYNNTTAANNNYRYSFNGQEKSDEIALNTTTAKYWEYDSRIERRWNLDPKDDSAKSNSYTAFSDNPILRIDPFGDTVVVLHAPTGAHGTGHAAILIQDKDGKYALYSKNGTNESSGLSGPNDKGHGNDNGESKDAIKYNSPDDFLNSDQNPVINTKTGEREYSEGYIIPTTPSQDRGAEAGAEKELAKPYAVLGSNCIVTVQSALTGAGLKDGSPSTWSSIWHWTLSPFAGEINDKTPNIIYDRIKDQNPGGEAHQPAPQPQYFTNPFQ
jgi:YD repeat-containing protein